MATEHTDKKVENEGRKLAKQVAQGFNLSNDVTHWLWPRKPMSGHAPGAANGQAKGQSKSQSKGKVSHGSKRSGRASKKSPMPGW